jgi:hypothetical protein
MRLSRLIVVAGLLPIAMLLFALTASAEERTVVLEANLTVPVIEKTALGALTATYDTETGAGTWEFQGTIDGQFAQASGSGTLSGSGSSATIAMTSIDHWAMPGIAQPAGGVTATIESAGDLAYVSISGLAVPIVAVPVAVSEPISFPLEAGTYTLSTAGSGSTTVASLPNTGGDPAEVAGDSLAPVLIAGVAGFAAAVVAAAVAAERRRLRVAR